MKDHNHRTSGILSINPKPKLYNCGIFTKGKTRLLLPLKDIEVLGYYWLFNFWDGPTLCTDISPPERPLISMGPIDIFYACQPLQFKYLIYFQKCDVVTFITEHHYHHPANSSAYTEVIFPLHSLTWVRTFRDIHDLSQWTFRPIHHSKLDIFQKLFVLIHHNSAMVVISCNVISVQNQLCEKGLHFKRYISFPCYSA